MARHLSRRRLLAFLALADPKREDFAEVLEHLAEECPACRAEIETVLRTPVLRLPQKSGRLHESFPKAIEQARSKHATWSRFRMIAQAEAAELVKLPPDFRRSRILRAHTRFRNPALVDLLLEESKKQMPRDPREAYDLADCAHAVALRLPDRDVPHTMAITLLARATAYRANALRVQGSLHQAETLLTSAVALFDQEGTADPLVQAELMELSASLARGQRKLIDAEGFLSMAQGLYRQCGEFGQYHRVLVTKGMVQLEAGDLVGALANTREALAGINRQTDPWLYLCAAHNIATYLTELGRYDEARDTIWRHLDLYASFAGHVIHWRRLWIEARIERAEGRIGAAEARLCEVKERFAETGHGYDAALVSLDLALIYLETGRHEQVRRTAEAMANVFMAEDIHREAVAAVHLFQEAVRQDAVTASMLLELIAYLKRIRGAQGEAVS